MITKARPGYEKYPFCRVCGEPLIYASAVEIGTGLKSEWRCEKHRDRNPCAIEGCKRSRAAEGRLDGGGNWLCGTHWRIGVPPRSRARRQYHWFFRQAKRHGWEARIGRRNEILRIQFYMYWHRLVRRARRRCGGQADLSDMPAELADKLKRQGIL